MTGKGSALARTWGRTIAVAFAASRCDSFSSDAPFTGKMMAIEVEQKFTMTEGPEVLEDLGFVPTRKEPVVMIDWYFDDDLCSLIRRDCWLRYRALRQKRSSSTTFAEITDGKWQLKAGSASGSMTTVYTELEGSEAIGEALSKLDCFQGKVPKLPDDLLSFRNSIAAPVSIPNTGLTAFAQIGTCRSSWRTTDELFRFINIDLDVTDFGYSVGEVEIEVTDKNLVEKAKERVQEVIEAISGPPNPQGDKTMGKLEYYLRHQRPDIYKLCVECGVIGIHSA